MSEFNDRVRDSAAIARLREANATLAKLSTRDWEHQSRINLVHRLASVAKDTLARLSANRELIAEETLNNLDGPSSDFLNWVNELAETPTDDDSYWSEASDAADTVLLCASSLPALRIRTSGEVFERVAGQFDRDVQSSAAALLGEVEEIRSQLDNVRAHLEEASSQFHGLVAELNTRVDERTAQAEATSQTLLEQTREATERLEREVTSIQEVFRNSQAEREEEFKKSQSNRDQRFQKRVNPVLSNAEDLRDQARSMLEEVAGASSAEHYSTQRASQKKAADLWRRIGVGSSILLVLAAGWIFSDSDSAAEGSSVVWLVARSGLIGSILLLALYSLRQSGQHRSREKEIDRVANELVLLWPFMSRLPDEDRKQLMMHITPLYFKGGISVQDEGDKQPPSTGVLAQMFRRRQEE